MAFPCSCCHIANKNTICEQNKHEFAETKPFLHEILSDEQSQIDVLTAINSDLRKANVRFAKKHNSITNVNDGLSKANAELHDFNESLTIERDNARNSYDIIEKERRSTAIHSTTVNLGTYDRETADKIQKELKRIRKADRTQGTRKIERVRRKGRGSRKEHGNDSYIALEHATGVAMYIDLKA
jgi:hypothetical protein